MEGTASSPINSKQCLEKCIQSVDVALTALEENTATHTRKRRRSGEPPVGLGKPYEQLKNLLQPALLGGGSSNVSAILMGPRGSGKSLVLDSVLETMDRSKFRLIRLHGLVVRGDCVSVVATEIVRQLADIAQTTSTHESHNKQFDSLLRAKQASTASNLSLLEETLKLADVEKIPILIVLDELDSFVASSASAIDQASKDAPTGGARQVLLYLLLDRVATQGSSINFIGMTTNLSTVNHLEKRVRSRAEGTSKLIYVRPSYSSYEEFGKVVLSAFDQVGEDVEWRKKVGNVFGALDDDDEQRLSTDLTNIRAVFQRNVFLGMDTRWFRNVLQCCLRDYNMYLREKLAEPTTPDETFESILLQSLASMGASHAGTDENVSCPRLSFMGNLSGPQVALVFSARRILTRDDSITSQGKIPNPLTLSRLLKDYQSYTGSSNRYKRETLLRAFTQLLEMDVFRPSSDHSGAGPLQYGGNRAVYELDSHTLKNLPLHFPYSKEEVTDTMKSDNTFVCSTALRDWGLKTN